MALTIFLWSQMLLHFGAAAFGYLSPMNRLIQIGFGGWAMLLLIFPEWY